MGLIPGLFGKPPPAPRDLGGCPFVVIMFAIKFKQAHKNRGKIQLGCGSSPGRSESFTGFSSEVLRSQPGLPSGTKNSLQTQTGNMANGLGISLKGLHKSLCTAARALTGDNSQQLLGGGAEILKLRSKHQNLTPSFVLGHAAEWDNSSGCPSAWAALWGWQRRKTCLHP